MSDEVNNAITQLRELLNAYPNKTLEILQYVFGKDTIREILNKPTYEDLQQENKQLKEKLNCDLQWALKYDELYFENKQLKEDIQFCLTSIKQEMDMSTDERTRKEMTTCYETLKRYGK